MCFFFQIVVDDSDKPWILYDAGPRCVRCPLVCLPPASGRADVFFKQLLALASKGYRVLAVSIFFAAFIRCLKNLLQGFLGSV